MIKFLSKEYFIRSLYAFYSGLVHSICYGVCMQISYAVVLIWAKRECHRAYATENAKKKNLQQSKLSKYPRVSAIKP